MSDGRFEISDRAERAGDDGQRGPQLADTRRGHHG